MLELIDFNEIEMPQIRAFLKTLKDDKLVGELNGRDIDPIFCGDILCLQRHRIMGSVLVDSNGNIQGMFIGTVASQWFDPDTVCFNEMLLFVMPKYRKGNNFTRMLTAVEAKCKQQGITTLQVGNAMRMDVDGFKRLLEHKGFKASPIFRKQL